MRDRHSFMNKVGRTFARIFLEFNIHPVLYVILLVVSLLHTIVAMLHPSSELYFLLEWVDPSITLDQDIFVFTFIGLALISTVTIIIMFFFAIFKLYLNETTFSKYLIAISMIISLILYYPMLFPLVRSGIILNQKASTFAVALISSLTVGFFLYFTYFIVSLLYVEQSPASTRLYATVQNPNALFVSNVFRLLLAIVTSLADPIYAMIPIGLFLPLMLISLFKYPFISCHLNTFIQCLMSSIIWVMITRFIQLFYNSTLPSAIIIIGLPIFNFFTLWLLHKRLEQVLQNKNLTVKQFKCLYKMINEFDTYYSELYLFLIRHYKDCEIVDCFCHKIIEQVNIKDEQLRKELKISEEKRLKRKEEEKILWYELLIQFLNRFYDYEELKNIPASDRVKKIRKMIPISVDRSEILYQKLHRRHTSLINMWYMQEEMQKQNITNLTFWIRFFMLEVHIQLEMETNFKKGSGIEEYTWNFYNFQFRLNQFRVMLFKIVTKMHEFWEQLASKLPDQGKILSLIERIFSFNQQINKQYRYYRKKSQSEGNSEYENRWNLGVKAIIDSFYIPYLKVIEGNDGDSAISKLEATLAQFKKSQPSYMYSKDITFFDCSSGTAMAVVNINEGENFGNILVGNKEFWGVLQCPRYSNVTYCKFVLEQMGEWHAKTIKNFLKSDSYYLNYITGFIIDTVGYTMEVQFTVQVIPNIYYGLRAAGFARPIPQRAIFVINKTSEIIIYTRQFQAFILDKISIEEFDDMVTKECIEQIDQKGFFQLEIQNRVYYVHCVRLRHYGPEYRRIIYYCQILDKNEDEMIAAPTDEDEKIVEAEEVETSAMQEGKDLEVKHEKSSSFLKQKSMETRIQQTIIKNKQALKYVFSVVENDGECRSIERWFIVSILLLGFLVVVCIVVLILIFPKSELLYKTNTEYNQYHNMMKGLIDSSYYARRININQYEKESIYKQVEKLKQMNQLLEFSMKNTAVFSDMSIRSIKLSTNNIASMSDEPLSAVLLKYIVSSYTYVSQNPEPAFDYIKDQLSIPYSPTIVNFYSALYNNIYICEPFIRQQRPEFLTKSSEESITGFQNQANVMIIIFGCLICFSIIIATSITSFKISGLKDFCFELLATLKMEKVEERSKTIKDYSDADLSDLIVTEDKPMEKASKKEKDKEKKKKNQEHERTMIEDMNQGNGQLQVTGRDLLPQKTFKNMDSINSNKKKRNNLKITGTKKCEIFWKFFLVIFPALALLNAMMIVQFENNSLNQYKLQVRTLLDQRMETIRLIKTYDQEIALQRDLGQIEDKVEKVADKLKGAILSLYQIQRQIQEKLSERQTSLKQMIKVHQKNSVCKTFEEAISSQEDEIITFSLEDCEELFDDNFISNGVPAAIVFFLDTSTSIQDEFKHAENLTNSEIRNFVLRSQHETLQKLTYFLSRLQADLFLIYEEEFILDIEQEGQTMIILCISCIVVVLLIFMLGLRKFKSWMYYDISLIKTVFHLLSYREIEQDQRLANLVVEKKDDFRFIG